MSGRGGLTTAGLGPVGTSKGSATTAPFSPGAVRVRVAHVAAG